LSSPGASVALQQLLELGARAGAFLQDPVDVRDLFPVAGQPAPLPRVEKIQERERALRVRALGVPQLLDEDGSQLGPGRAVPRLRSLDLGDRLIAGVAESDVAVGLAWILPTQSLDKCPLALVDAGVVAGLLRK